MNNKINLYKELKNKHSKEYDNFYQSGGVFYAFSNKQFKEGMEKIGLNEDETDKIISFGSGCFMLKTKVKDYELLGNKFHKEDQEARKSDQYLYDMFIYEMGNHEYGYTYNLDDTLEALDLTIEEVNNNKRLLKALKMAKKDYLAMCD